MVLYIDQQIWHFDTQKKKKKRKKRRLLLLVFLRCLNFFSASVGKPCMWSFLDFQWFAPAFFFFFFFFPRERYGAIFQKDLTACFRAFCKESVFSIEYGRTMMGCFVLYFQMLFLVESHAVSCSALNHTSDLFVSEILCSLYNYMLIFA